MGAGALHPARGDLVAGDVGAVGAQRLAQRADDHGDLALEPGLGTGAASPRADRADRVRLVDHHRHVMAVGEADDVLERRDVAVGGEDPVGDDQPGTIAVLLQPPGEMVCVAVLVDERLRAGEPAPVDDRQRG